MKNKEIISGSDKIKFIYNDGKIITSNNFLFEIKKNTFNINDNVTIIDNIKNLKVFVDKIFYNKNEEIIISKGNTKVLYDKIYSFDSKQNLKIDLSNNMISATDDVKLIDLQKNYKFISDKIIFYKNDDKIITKGKTDVYIENRFILKSKDISFSNRSKIFKSKKKLHYLI